MYVYQFLNSNSNFKTVSFKSSKFTICHKNPYPEQDHLRNSNFATLFQTYYWKWLNTVEPLFCSTYRGFIRSYDPGSSTCDLRRAEYIMNLYGTHNIKKINKRCTDYFIHTNLKGFGSIYFSWRLIIWHHWSLTSQPWTPPIRYIAWIWPRFYRRSNILRAEHIDCLRED